MFSEVSSRPVPETRAESNIPPFLANVLGAMATSLGGKADLNESTVYTDCGRITLGMGESDTIWVHGLYIDSDKQREGCGTKKLKALEEAVSRLALNTMKIKLWPVRSAVGFYLKNGFGLVVETTDVDRYVMARDKAYGSGMDQYLAKTRLAMDEKAGEEPWTHEMVWPMYEKSKIFDESEPMFYSLWTSDIAGGYEHAVKVVQPTRGRMMGRSV